MKLKVVLNNRTCLLPASPQMVSLLGSNFSNSLGNGAQTQPAIGNGQLSSMGMVNDGASSDGAAFDINDFPQLSTRPSSAGSQGGLGACLFLSPKYMLALRICNHWRNWFTASIRKQVGVNPIVQQSQEFSIQNEDFPALPGFKGMSKNIDGCISKGYIGNQNED